MFVYYFEDSLCLKENPCYKILLMGTDNKDEMFHVLYLSYNDGFVFFHLCVCVCVCVYYALMNAFMFTYA